MSGVLALQSPPEEHPLNSIGCASFLGCMSQIGGISPETIEPEV